MRTKVIIWGKTVGYAEWLTEENRAAFQYDPGFLSSGLQLAPITMPLSSAVYDFPQLSKDTYKGLPAMLADSLPDSFARKVMDAYYQATGKEASRVTPLEYLCYLGKRGMGALEYEPAIPEKKFANSVLINLEELTSLANAVLSRRQNITAKGHDALIDILRVGTSAGGARAKAVVAYNEKTRELRSGQVDAPEGFEHWLLKFDGVDNDTFREPKGFGRIEYAYYLMAKAAGVEMTECRLLEENGRAHFMTRRFDRNGNKKLHMQTLCAIAQMDYRRPEGNSYELAFRALRALNLDYSQQEELYRRVLFNIIARNQDDHTKNISFLMNTSGEWSLSPAYDIAYAYNPEGEWTAMHQMSMLGKRKDFSRDDMLQFGKLQGVKKAPDILEKVLEAVSNWKTFAQQAGLDGVMTKQISAAHLVDQLGTEHK